MNRREEEQLINESAKRNFDTVAKNVRILCVFDQAYLSGNNSFVQVKLKVITEQPEYVEEIERDEEVFGDNSKENVCYVKAEEFRNFILRDDSIDIRDNTDLQKVINIVNEYLKNKLIIIKPFYYFKEDEAIFYKNGKVYDVIQKYENKTQKYYLVPIIRNNNLFDKINSGESVSLTNISGLILRSPKYISFDKKIYKLPLECLEDEEKSYTYWRKSDESISPVLIDIDYEDFEKKNEIIYNTNCDYAFISESSILKRKEKKITKEELNKENKNQDQYGYTNITETIQNFSKYIGQSNLCYTIDDLNNFFTCLRSSQLVILAGMSGTGKTKLPLKFAEFFNMSEENNELLFVPVSPSFTEPSDVLGYLNPNTGIYTPSDTRLVEFLNHASNNINKMHMVIFDEMNLSQIEYWFAPFMSILEKGNEEKNIYLYSENQRCLNSEKYPEKIKIGKNVVFVGTINLDETTKNISDRLLDRAFVINLKKMSFKDYSQTNIDIKEEVKKSSENFFEYIPENDVEEYNYISKFSIEQLEFFDKIHEILNKIDPQKGVSFRSVKNIALYLKNKPDEFDERKAFDYAFKQTIIKKINGSTESIGMFLGLENISNEESLIDIFDEYNMISDFSESRKEIENKVAELRKYGYTK